MKDEDFKHLRFVFLFPVVIALLLGPFLVFLFAMNIVDNFDSLLSIKDKLTLFGAPGAGIICCIAIAKWGLKIFKENKP